MNSLDLTRFPIDRPGSADYAALIARCREDLVATGMFNLDGFVRPDAAQAMADAALRDLQHAFRHVRDHNIYFQDDIADLPSDHPALRRFETSNFTLCADQLAANPITAVYEFAPLRRFLADVMNVPALHLMDDPLARLNVMTYGAGDALNWHFDRSEFTTTLLLQQPEAGGDFQYRTALRRAEDPNYDGVARMLDGGDSAVQTLKAQPGTLNVFKGINTAHRVTPVEGPRPRVIAVFSYYERPGVQFSDAERRGFYGRAD